MYCGFDFCDETVSLSARAEKDCEKRFAEIDENCMLWSGRILDAFQKCNVSTSDFLEITGYGYDDPGRDKIEKIYSRIFGTQDALVRPQMMSGTHALALTLGGLLKYGTEIMTVYSFEKAREISEEAEKLGIIQDIMFRILDEKSSIYPGQEAGIDLCDLEDITKKILTLKNVRINGLTSFPCFLYNETNNTIEKTENIGVILKAYNILKEKFNMNKKESTALLIQKL